MAWSWRTIFLLIRGIDQTGRAFEKPKRELTELQKRQKALARSSYRLLFAGAAFLAFGLMSAKALSGLWQLTSKGRLAADDLGRAWKRLATGVAEAITTILGPTLKSLTKWLDNIAANKAWTGLLAMLGIGATGGAIVGGGLALGGALAGGITGLLVKLGLVTGGAAAGGGLTALYEHIAAGGTAGTFAGAGAKAGILARIAGWFGGIKGAVASIGAGGVLGVAIPVVITLMIAKTLWDWYGMSHEEQVDFAIKAGEKQAALRQKFGISDEQYYTDQARAEAYRQMGMTGDINIDIYGNVFPYDMDEAALAAQLGYNIYDEYSNLNGAYP